MMQACTVACACITQPSRRDPRAYQYIYAGPLLLVAMGFMNVTWMAVIAVLVVAQKFPPARTAIDVPLALAIVGLGFVIVIAPSSIPGLTPPMGMVARGVSHAHR